MPPSGGSSVGDVTGPGGRSLGACSALRGERGAVGLPARGAGVGQLLAPGGEGGGERIVKAGARSVAAGCFVGAGVEAGLRGGPAGLHGGVVDRDWSVRAASTVSTAAPTVAHAAVAHPTVGARRRSKEATKALGTPTTASTTFTRSTTHARTASITMATPVSVASALRHSRGQAGVERGLAVGLDGALGGLAGLEGLEAGVDGGARALRVTLGRHQRRGLGGDVDRRRARPAGDEGKGARESSEDPETTREE